MSIPIRLVFVVSAFFAVSGLVAQPESRDRPPRHHERRYPQDNYDGRHAAPPPPPRDEYRDRDYRRPEPNRDRDYRDYDRPAPQAQYPKRKGKWQVVAQQRAAGEAKEISLSGGGYTQCKIQCSSGRVVLNTVVIRRGAKKQPVTVATAITPGQEVTIPVDRAATGLRISDGGGGIYKVWVK